MYIWVSMRISHMSQNQTKSNPRPPTITHQLSYHIIPGRVLDPNRSRAAGLDQHIACNIFCSLSMYRSRGIPSSCIPTLLPCERLPRIPELLALRCTICWRAILYRCSIRRTTIVPLPLYLIRLLILNLRLRYLLRLWLNRRLSRYLVARHWHRRQRRHALHEAGQCRRHFVVIGPCELRKIRERLARGGDQNVRVCVRGEEVKCLSASVPRFTLASFQSRNERTATPLKSALSSRNLLVPLNPAIPSVAPGLLGGALHFKSQHPPPLTVRIQYASSAPRLTKLGASAPPAFQVVFHASWLSTRFRIAFSSLGGRLDQEADVLSQA
jgi:hypothetical protein